MPLFLTQFLGIKKGNHKGSLLYQLKTDYFAAEAAASATEAAAEAAASATVLAAATADAGAEAASVVEATTVEAGAEAAAGAASSFLLQAVIAKDAATKLDTAINLTFITCSPKENNPVFT